MKLCFPLTLALFLGLNLTPAWAGTNLAQADRGGNSGVQVERPPQLLQESDSFVGGTVRDKRVPNGQTLRCWQNGRLLYEGSGFQRQGDRNPSAISLPRTDDNALTVFDLKQGMCILSGN